jgi:hypothetical protein
MKLFLAISFSLFFGLNIFAQTEINRNAVLVQTVGIEDLYLAKDDGSGKIGDVAESFLTTDVPIYCVVMLDSTRPALVRMNFVAVSVKGVKPETRVISISYKTNGKEDRVDFTGKPDRVWVAGTYRIDIFIDDKPAGKRSFEIRNAQADPEKPTVVEVKNFIPPKTRPAPKTVRRPRRN